LARDGLACVLRPSLCSTTHVLPSIRVQPENLGRSREFCVYCWMEAVRRASRGLLGNQNQNRQSQDAAAHREQSGSDADQEASETEPLLEDRRRNSERRVSTEGHMQFVAAQREAAQDVARETGWLTYIGFFLAACVIFFWSYVTVQSWYVLITYYDKPCDQPLNQWLLVKLLLDAFISNFQERPQHGDAPRPSTYFYLGLQNGWLIMGYHWSFTAKTCATTNPDLFFWVRFLVIFGTVIVVLMMALPLFFYLVILIVLFLVRSGGLKNHRAAREDTLSLLKTVEYQPDLFADPADPNDQRPSGECCCCVEEFNSEKAIVQTPCGHYFHQSCLGDWLKLARTCPLCRTDLDVATEEGRPDVEMGSGSDGVGLGLGRDDALERPGASSSSA